MKVFQHRRLVLSLVEVIKDTGNPFLDQSEELLILDTCDVLGESVVETVRNWGKNSLKATTSLSFLTVLALFMSQSKRIVSHSLNAHNTKQLKAVENLKHDVSLFSRLYIVAKNRD